MSASPLSPACKARMLQSASPQEAPGDGKGEARLPVTLGFW